LGGDRNKNESKRNWTRIYRPVEVNKKRLLLTIVWDR